MSISTDFTVRDVLLPIERMPVVEPKTMFKKTLEAMSRCRLGIACIVDDEGKLVGIVTDGDVRRKLLKKQKPFPALFADDTIQHANTNPTTIDADANLRDVIVLMEKKEIWDLPVVDSDHRLLGILHLLPAIEALLGDA